MVRPDLLRDADAERSIRLLHALPAVFLELEERPNRVDVLGHDIRLLVHRLEVVQAFAVDDVHAIPPNGDLVQVGTAPREVAGHLHDLGRGLDTIPTGHERDPREPLPYVENLRRVRGLLQVNGQRVQVHNRRGHLDRDRMNVEVRQDALYVWAMVARHFELRLDRVDGTFLRIAWVRRSAHHDREHLLHAHVGIERVERPDEPRRVARGHAHERRAKAVRIIRGRVEGQVRQRVLLAALPDRLHARLFVERLVPAVLRRAIDDEIRFSPEIVGDPRGFPPGLLPLPQPVFFRRGPRLSFPHPPPPFPNRLSLPDPGPGQARPGP